VSGTSEGAGPGSAAALRAGFAGTGMSLRELWMAHLALGGLLTVRELADTLGLRREASCHEHDVVAAALNDWFTERGREQRVPYSEALRAEGPQGVQRGHE
jgi:hypothetical protein